jgi:hypothetical protein
LGSRAARPAAWRSWRTGRSTAGDTTATDRKPGTSRVPVYRVAAQPVLRIRSVCFWIQDPIVRGMDPAPDPSVKKIVKKT